MEIHISLKRSSINTGKIGAEISPVKLRPWFCNVDIDREQSNTTVSIRSVRPYSRPRLLCVGGRSAGE